ncbi:MAG TPA: DUF308 domain-containing protein [Vicinamibacterales bacterium]|nr:DUF308 domain-containing protein [Vicinamibacterales bacterium]
MAPTTTFKDDVRTTANWSIALSVLMMLTGVIALFAPAITGVTVTLFFGWLLIISGALHIGYAWRASGASAILWEILTAIVYAGAGFYLITRPVLGLEALTIALVAYLVLESALEFVLAFTLRPLPGSGWLVGDGIITLLLAVLIGSGFPASSVWAIGTLVAISMFFSGLTRLMLSTAVRRIVA